MTDAAKLREHDTGDFPVVWREETDGLTAEIRLDDDSAHANPRHHYNNLGTILAWHPDYYLGDQQFTDGAGRGAVRNAYDGDIEFDSIGELATRLVDSGALCVLPLYLFDHSGISISAGANYVGRGDTASGGYDDFGNARGWDTTLVGVIYTTPARIEELCGKPQVETDAVYCPRTWPEDGRSGRNWPAERSAEEWIAQQLRHEVELYDRYLKGEVYWWCVDDEGDDVIESCGGYLPDVGVPHAEELDYVRGEAHDALVEAVEEQCEKAAREREEATRAANMDIATA